MTIREPMPLNSESSGKAPGRGRLAGRRILVVGGGQRVFDAETDPIGNGRAMCRLFGREGAMVAIADVSLESAQTSLDWVREEGSDGVAIETAKSPQT